MAITSSRQQFIDYCLRRLGYPVIDINVDPEQISDRVDDALLKYRDYHYDGTEHVYFKIKVTAEDIANQYFTLPENLIGVVRIFRISTGLNSSSMFNIRYQMMLSNMYTFTTLDMAPYVMAMRQIESIDEILSGEKPIRFTRHNNKLHVDMMWSVDVSVDDYIIVDGYMTLDPEVYTDIWNDPWIKKYATALIKRQWGENITKFEGMQMPGGITFNGRQILQDAMDEIAKMEEELINTYSLPVSDMVG
jgi:hypothetical protein